MNERVPGVQCLTSDVPATVIIPTSVYTHLASHSQGGGGGRKPASCVCYGEGQNCLGCETEGKPTIEGFAYRPQLKDHHA